MKIDYVCSSFNTFFEISLTILILNEQIIIVERSFEDYCFVFGLNDILIMFTV